MEKSIKKSGRKVIRKFSRVSVKVGMESREHIRNNFLKRLSHIANIRLLVLEWALSVIALIMLAITQAFWFSDSYSESVFSSGGTFTEATLGEVKSMNPLFATTSSEKVLSKLLFATISEIDYSGHYGMGLAQYIRPSEDGKIWTVKLKDNLKWSDNEPITNKDVIYTINLIKNPVVNSIYYANFSNVNVSENENGEIIFTLKSAFADFIAALDVPILPEHILGSTDPKNIVENDFSISPITSGSFTFNAVQTTNKSSESVYYLSSNKNYYENPTLLSGFAIHTYENKEDIIAAINSSNVTATAELSGDDISKISSRQFNQKNSSLNSGVFAFFNLKREYPKNRDFRFAVRQGMNIDNLRAAAPETTNLDYPLIDKQIKISNYPEIPGYDQEAAKNKIAEISGGEPIYINIATVNSGYLPDVAEKIKTELALIGIEANISIYEENQDFVNNVIAKRNYDILLYDIELGADPDVLPYYYSLQATSTGLNLSNYQNILVDDLLLGARDTLNKELRIKKYESFLQYWVNDVPAIAIYQPNLTYIYNRNARIFSNDVRLVKGMDRFSDITSWATVKTMKNKTP